MWPKEMLPNNSKDIQSRWKQLREILHVGDEVSGVVQHQAPFGVFVDIGMGFTALLRITDFARVSDAPLEFPKDYPSLDSEVTGQVIGFEASSAQIILTQKKMSPQQWETLKQWAQGTEDLPEPLIDDAAEELEQLRWGRLRVNRVFQITGRGGVAAGDIVSGVIRVGMWTQPLLINGVEKRLKVSGVEFIDYRQEQRAEVGLVFESKPDRMALGRV